MTPVTIVDAWADASPFFMTFFTPSFTTSVSGETDGVRLGLKFTAPGSEDADLTSLTFGTGVGTGVGAGLGFGINGFIIDPMINSIKMVCMILLPLIFLAGR